MGSDCPKVIALFDLDGTLTEPRKEATPEVLQYLRKLREIVTVGIISGSDAPKVKEQLGEDAASDSFDYLFVENGVVSYKGAELFHSNSLSEYLGEPLVKELVNFTLRYFSELDLPVKRGTFIEYRTGMMNFSPVGRNCSYEERLQFNEYDKQHHIRNDFVDKLESKFDSRNLHFSIGGQISVDCFPKGWDKRYCLQFLEKDFDKIHFFGDKTSPGGNDFEIFDDKRTIGHTVTGPEDTLQQLRQLFFLK